MNIAVCVDAETNNSILLEKAIQLANILGLPVCSPESAEPEFVLKYETGSLSLHAASFLSHNQRPAPLQIDFLHGSVGYRHRHNLTIHQPLAKAVGIRPGFRPDVLDATAGLGRDGFVLACLGCTVTFCERSPILWALLSDGLERARNDNTTADIISSRITLHQADARQYLSQQASQPHTIYLDPMYPHSDKAALNKIDMRILRELAGNDDDSPELLSAALKHASNRVVVKRPQKAGCLSTTKPTYSVNMKHHRFDVYLTSHL